MSSAIAAPELEQRALSLPEQARALRITDHASFVLAAERLKDFAAMRKEIEDHHREIKKKADEAHKAACAAEKRLLDPVKEAEWILRDALAAYDVEQKRIAAEAERQARIAAEARAEEERLAAAVEVVEQGGSEAEAQAVYEMPVAIPLVRPVQAQPKVAGLSMPTIYGAEVVDIKALCRSIAEGHTPPHYVSPNMTAINQQARAMRESFNVPGCRVTTTTSPRVSTGRR